MRRGVLVILIVAVLSAWIARAEQAPQARATTTDWIRTSQGWQSRTVLAAPTSVGGPTIHPGLVAAFQLGASIFCLLAFPARVRRQAPAASQEEHGLRPRHRVPQSGRRVAVG